MGIFSPRPKARIKLHDHFMGEKTSTTATGYAIYKEWDKADGKHYYWEEWEIRGLKDFDSWLEYDHYTGLITLYEPVKVAHPIDPTTLHIGQQIKTTIEGKEATLTVREVGHSTVARIEGTLSYHIFLNEPMVYAEIAYTVGNENGVISAERYNTKEFDVYKGRVLKKADQKKVLGRVVQPVIRGTTVWSLFSVLFFVGLLTFAFIPRSETYCTPRTVTNPSGTPTASADKQVSQSDSQTCYKRTIYGGGSSGVGK